MNRSYYIFGIIMALALGGCIPKKSTSVMDAAGSSNASSLQNFILSKPATIYHIATVPVGSKAALIQYWQKTFPGFAAQNKAGASVKNNVAGYGIYFAVDPLSTFDYGPNLVMVNLKAGTPIVLLNGDPMHDANISPADSAAIAGKAPVLMYPYEKQTGGYIPDPKSTAHGFGYAIVVRSLDVLDLGTVQTFDAVHTVDTTKIPTLAQPTSITDALTMAYKIGTFQQNVDLMGQSPSTTAFLTLIADGLYRREPWSPAKPLVPTPELLFWLGSEMYPNAILPINGQTVTLTDPGVQSLRQDVDMNRLWEGGSGQSAGGVSAAIKLGLIPAGSAPKTQEDEINLMVKSLTPANTAALTSHYRFFNKMMTLVNAQSLAVALKPAPAN